MSDYDALMHTIGMLAGLFVGWTLMGWRRSVVAKRHAEAQVAAAKKAATIASIEAAQKSLDDLKAVVDDAKTAVEELRSKGG